MSKWVEMYGWQMLFVELLLKLEQRCQNLHLTFWVVKSKNIIHETVSQIGETKKNKVCNNSRV